MLSSHMPKYGMGIAACFTFKSAPSETVPSVTMLGGKLE